jgi:5-bromo-4-chloroindolyl phosphate hydrolysis protein
MGNSTHLFSTLSSDTDSANKFKKMDKQDPELSREEQHCLNQTRKALDTIIYSPRPETIRAIAEYAKKTQPAK